MKKSGMKQKLAYIKYGLGWHTSNMEKKLEYIKP